MKHDFSSEDKLYTSPQAKKLYEAMAYDKPLEEIASAYKSLLKYNIVVQAPTDWIDEQIINYINKTTMR